MVMIVRVCVTYLQIRNLPTVTNPAEFAQQFNYENSTPVSLKVGSKGSPWPSGRIVISSFFPHRELQTFQVESSCPRKYFNSDPVWKIFWVEVTVCGEKTRFYGPYQLDLEKKQ